MRDPARIEKVLSVIRNKWYERPDLRLGQLIVIANDNKDPFYMEDDILIKKLKEL